MFADNPGMGPYDPADITSAAVTPAQSAAWYDVIGRWEQSATDFQSYYNELTSQDTASFIATQDEATKQQYLDLIDRAEKTRRTIAYIQGALQDVKNALSGTWNAISGAWQGVKDYVGLSGGLGLGFLPLVPIAVVAAALAAITIWTTDYLQFREKVNLLRQGYTSSQISATLGSKGGLTSSLGMLLLIGGGILAVMYLPKLIGSYRTALK